jgi:hypothetical protein
MGWCSQLLLRNKEFVWTIEEPWVLTWAPHSCLILTTELHADHEWSLSLLWQGSLWAPHGVLSLTVICDFRTCAESQYTSVDGKCRVEAIGIAHRQAGHLWVISVCRFLAIPGLRCALRMKSPSWAQEGLAQMYPHLGCIFLKEWAVGAPASLTVRLQNGLADSFPAVRGLRDPAGVSEGLCPQSPSEMRN